MGGQNNEESIWNRRSLSETVGPVVYQRIGLVHKVNGPPAA